MGASFETLTMPGTLTRIEVRSRFTDAQDQDRHENGHSYSGGIGMATGLEFREDKFPSIDAATDWLCDQAEKYEDALAVRATDDQPLRWDGKPNPRYGVELWVIGAICAS